MALRVLNCKGLGGGGAALWVRPFWGPDLQLAPLPCLDWRGNIPGSQCITGCMGFVGVHD